MHQRSQEERPATLRAALYEAYNGEALRRLAGALGVAGPTRKADLAAAIAIAVLGPLPGGVQTRLHVPAQALCIRAVTAFRRRRASCGRPSQAPEQRSWTILSGEPRIAKNRASNARRMSHRAPSSVGEVTTILTVAPGNSARHVPSASFAYSVLSRISSSVSYMTTSLW